ncbi:hypothetical protein CS954_03080 [Bacillus siamensis]|nr:hypothetical protein CS954_03080 [Bacillus siamensis]
MTALEIAKYFISKSFPETSENITNLKLQKILYYAQGNYLAENGLDKPLFNEELQAWIHGPVVPEVYHEFKIYGFNEIPKTQNNCSHLPLPVTSFLDRIWDKYKSYTGKELEDMTHDELPWRNARNGLPPYISSNSTILKKDLFKFFTNG